MEARAEPTFTELARRRQIVAGAIEVIAEVGVAQATFVRIAERIGISPALISYHFTSRSELLRAIAMTIEAELEAWTADAVSKASSPRDAVRSIVVAFVRFVEGHRHEMLALRQLEATLAPAARAGIAALDREHGIDRWESLLREGQDAGDLGAFDARIVAAALMGILESVPTLLLGSGAPDASRLAEELASFVDRAIAHGRG